MKIKNGFTLLEVVLSMTIFAVLAVGTINAMPRAKRGNIMRLDHLQAMLILEQKMAQIRIDYAEDGSISVVPPTSTLSLRDGLPANLAMTVTMRNGDNWVPVDPNVRVGLRRVKLNLNWTNTSNAAESVELDGLVFRG